MKLVREKVGIGSKFKNDRHVFRIHGRPEDAKLIELIDNAIGLELVGFQVRSAYSGEMIDLTYHLYASDSCADYIYGTGVAWYIDIDDVKNFKALWNKHKSLLKNKD